MFCSTISCSFLYRVAAFWSACSKASAGATHARALTLFQQWSWGWTPEASWHPVLGLGVTQHHGRLTPPCFPASQSSGTHPACALAMGHASRIPRGKLWCTGKGSHHMILGPSVTRTGHVSQFTVSVASPGQTPESHLTSSWSCPSLIPCRMKKVAQSSPWCLVMRQFFCTGTFWLREQQAELTVGCPRGG